MFTRICNGTRERESTVVIHHRYTLKASAVRNFICRQSAATGNLLGTTLKFPLRLFYTYIYIYSDRPKPRRLRWLVSCTMLRVLFVFDANTIAVARVTTNPHVGF